MESVGLSPDLFAIVVVVVTVSVVVVDVVLVVVVVVVIVAVESILISGNIEMVHHCIDNSQHQFKRDRENKHVQYHRQRKIRSRTGIYINSAFKETDLAYFFAS